MRACSTVKHTLYPLPEQRANDTNLVDGGHRAIKYTRYVSWRLLSPPFLMEACRLHGVTENVYGEGTHLRVHVHAAFLVPFNAHTLVLDSMVRDTHRIRHPSEPEKYRKPDRHKRFGIDLHLHCLGISYKSRLTNG